MRYFIIIALFFLQSCSKPKVVLICGDHVCINKAEAEKFFEENLSIEVKIVDKKKQANIDLVELNLKENSNKDKQITIVEKDDTKEEIKILTNKEIKQIKKEIKEKNKNKKIVKKNNDINLINKKIKKDERKKILDSKRSETVKKNVNNRRKKVVDVCTIIEKCNIIEISKYLLEQGKKKGYPDITVNN